MKRCGFTVKSFFKFQILFFSIKINITGQAQVLSFSVRKIEIIEICPCLEFLMRLKVPSKHQAIFSNEWSYFSRRQISSFFVSPWKNFSGIFSNKECENWLKNCYIKIIQRVKFCTAVWSHLKNDARTNSEKLSDKSRISRTLKILYRGIIRPIKRATCQLCHVCLCSYYCCGIYICIPYIIIYIINFVPDITWPSQIPSHLWQLHKKETRVYIAKQNILFQVPSQFFSLHDRNYGT